MSKRHRATRYMRGIEVGPDPTVIPGGVRRRPRTSPGRLAEIRARRDVLADAHRDPTQRAVLVPHNQLHPVSNFHPPTHRAVGQGGHWAIGHSRWAAYQILQNRSSGARFLFVTPHLSVGAGTSNDARRQAETTNLLRLAHARAAAAGVPVIYAATSTAIPPARFTPSTVPASPCALRTSPMPTKSL